MKNDFVQGPEEGDKATATEADRIKELERLLDISEASKRQSLEEKDAKIREDAATIERLRKEGPAKPSGNGRKPEKAQSRDEEPIDVPFEKKTDAQPETKTRTKTKERPVEESVYQMASDDPVDDLFRAGERGTGFWKLRKQAMDTLPIIKKWRERSKEIVPICTDAIPDAAWLGSLAGAALGTGAVLQGAFGAPTVTAVLAGTAAGFGAGALIGVTVAVGAAAITIFVTEAMSHTVAAWLAAYARGWPLLGTCLLTLKSWWDGFVEFVYSCCGGTPASVAA